MVKQESVSKPSDIEDCNFDSSDYSRGSSDDDLTPKSNVEKVEEEDSSLEEESDGIEVKKPHVDPATAKILMKVITYLQMHEVISIIVPLSKSV